MVLELMLAACVAAPVAAPPAQVSHKHPTFAQLDKNGDGKITKDEATGRILKHFAQIDANGDGGITKQELAKYLAKAAKSKKSGGASGKSALIARGSAGKAARLK